MSQSQSSCWTSGIRHIECLMSVFRYAVLAIILFVVFIVLIDWSVVYFKNTSGETGEHVQLLTRHAEGTSTPASPTSPTTTLLTTTTAGCGVRCHIYMDKAQNYMDGKTCRVTPTLQSKLRMSSCSIMLENWIAFPPDEKMCCKVASACNKENYCGQGEMKCLDRNGTENPECVCHRGWHGRRCEMCSPKVKVPCWCFPSNHQHISEVECSSREAVLNRPCWLHHVINDQNHTCVCFQASDGQAFNEGTRCSGKRTVFCEFPISGSINGHAEGTSTPASPTITPLTMTTASCDFRCHIYMDKAQEYMNGKTCRVTPTLQSKQRMSSCSIKMDGMIEFSPGENRCCKVASACNQENYCGQGEMKCLDRNGTESPECVCHRGWHGRRCEMCSPKVKMPCWCFHTNLQDIIETACSSSEAVPNRFCRIHHLISDQRHACVCLPASDGQAFNAETRCSGDRTNLCKDIGHGDKRRSGT